MLSSDYPTSGTHWDMGRTYGANVRAADKRTFFALLCVVAGCGAGVIGVVLREPWLALCGPIAAGGLAVAARLSNLRDGRRIAAEVRKAGYRVDGAAPIWSAPEMVRWKTRNGLTSEILDQAGSAP